VEDISSVIGHGDSGVDRVRTLGIVLSVTEGFWRTIQTRSDQPKMMYVRHGFVLMTVPVFRWRNGKIDSFVISFNARMRNGSKVESFIISFVCEWGCC
jgi:hypothetical protein